jgi:O-antigen/teichoic acid export membrane protein
MLKQKFATQFGTNIIVKVVTMIAGFVVARIAGPTVLGTISYGTSYVSIWLFLTGIFAAGHMKLVSEGRDHGDCVATYVWLKTLSILLFIIVVLLSFAYQVKAQQVNFEAENQVAVIMVILVATVISQFYNIVSNSYTAMLMQAKANVPFVLQSIVFHTGRIIVVLLGGRALGLSLWQIAALILVMPLVIKYMKKLPFGRINKTLLSKYLYYGFPTLLLSAIYSVLQYADKLVLAHYTSIEELGFYSAAMSVGGTMLILSNSIGNIFFPLFSDLLKDNNWKEVNKKNKVYQEFSTLFILPLILLLALIAEPVLTTVLGSRYQHSVLPFKIIVISTYIVIVGMPYGNILTGMGRFYTNVWINASQLLVFVVSITFFISPKYLNLGATGLALNLMITYLYRNGAYIVVAKKIGSLQYDKTNLFRILTICLISAMFWIVSVYIKDVFAGWWIVIAPLYMTALYGILHLLKMITRQHYNTLLELVNIRKTARYIRSETKR